MSDEFFRVLGLSLMADYFNVSFLSENGRGYDLNFLCKKSIARNFANVFQGLDSNFSGWDCEEDQNYCWFEFNSEDDKEKVEDYFMQFNQINRKNALIAMPNLYEGSASVNVEICDYYLAAIEAMIESDFKTKIAIPFGISESDEKIRQFMLYDERQMLGLYKGTDIFNNNSIGVVN